MKRIVSLGLTCVLLAAQSGVYAGNKDRSGQAGASQLLNNPWAKSTGVFGSDGAYVSGLEAMKVNIAGLARGKKTEVAAAYTEYLAGTGISVINAGLSQNLGDKGAIGVNINTMNFGELDIVNYDNPEGGIGTFKGQIFNASIGYAKTFSDRIHAGVNVTFVSEGVNDAKAFGACFDAGIQYVTGKRDNFHFGIVLRNVGTNMRFTGSGYSYQFDVKGDYIYQVNRMNPTEKFEMPVYLNIALAYDFYLDENRVGTDSGYTNPKHRLTAMGSFISNSFNNDYLSAGLEYSFMERFNLRAAYRYERDIFNSEDMTTFYTGVSAGAGIMLPLGKSGQSLGIDYSYRPTKRPNNGLHCFSIRYLIN